MDFKYLVTVMAFGLAGCMSPQTLGYGPEPTTPLYTSPADSGLLGGRPYPNPKDVCRVIGENEATQNLLDDSALLIGCPKNETGAIADRLREGATVVGHAKHWTLLSVPN